MFFKASLVVGLTVDEFAKCKIVGASNRRFQCLLLKVTSQNDLIADICADNEVLTDCGSRCEPTCIQPYPECEGSCAVNVCRCKQGFIRREIEGPCIAETACPPHHPPPTCTGVRCHEHSHCEIVDLPCGNGRCPQEAVCIDNKVEDLLSL